MIPSEAEGVGWLVGWLVCWLVGWLVDKWIDSKQINSGGGEMLHTSVAVWEGSKQINKEENQDPFYQLGFKAYKSSIPICPRNREN